MIFVTHYWLLITRNTNTPSKLKKQKKNGSHVTMRSLAIGQFFICMRSQDQGCGHVLIIPSFHVANLLAPFVINCQVVLL